MKTLLEYKDEKSAKFWEIETNGTSHTVRYGKIGTKGTSKTKDFESEEKALKDAEKLKAAKDNELGRIRQAMREGSTFTVFDQQLSPLELLDYQDRVVIVNKLTEGATEYIEHGRFTDGDQATSILLDGFAVDVAKLFSAADAIKE